ncbi:MAG TPA: hypothetical protein VHZ56_01730 [Devosia sp.]|jgi:hypothetical protein|nr:hypothetical protein [Devosia sp.]
MSRILNTAAEIRQWTEARSGMPAWSELPSGTRSQIVLRLVFDQYLLNSGESQDLDRPGGLDLVGWDEWLGELKKQKLALRVGDRIEGVMDNDFEFVPEGTKP